MKSYSRRDALNPAAPAGRFSARPFAPSAQSRKGVVQCMKVKELTEAEQEKWYLVGSQTGKLTGVYVNQWEFRIRDDVYGKDQYVNINDGEKEVEPLGKFNLLLKSFYKDDEERWFGEEAERAKKSATSARTRQGQIQQISYKELLDIGEKTLPKNEVGENAYDTTHVKLGEGLWTDGMGPCITIAVTGVFEKPGDIHEKVEKIRVNALHHSFAQHYDQSKYPEIGQSIVKDIEEKVANAIGKPFSELKSPEIYVVGGDEDTAGKMEALLRTLISRKFHISGVIDKTNESSGSSSKALLIGADGRVSWSYEQK
jgi:hypothetical protein